MDSEGDEDSRTIFCANLHKRVTEEILYELFLQVGPVVRVRIPPNSNYGFVTYQHLCSIEYALEVFKDTELYGTPLRLKRRTKNKDESNNIPNNNQNSNYNSVLQTGNNYLQLGNIHQNMMPQNMMSPQLYNMYQNNDYYPSNSPHKPDRNRSPPRNKHNNQRIEYASQHTPRGRFQNNHHQNNRYDHDDKYDRRPIHYDRRNRKRHKH